MLVKVEVCLRGVLEPLVAVEVELRSDPFFLPLYCQSNGVQHQIYSLLCSGLVGHDAVVVEIPDYGQI